MQEDKLGVVKAEPTSVELEAGLVAGARLEATRGCLAGLSWIG